MILLNRKIIKNNLGFASINPDDRLKNIPSQHTAIAVEAWSGVEALTDPKFVSYVRNTLANYMKENGIDLANQGMRFALEVDQQGKICLYLIHEPAAAQDVVSWLLPNGVWTPGLEKGKGGFFEASAAGAKDHLDKMKFGNPLAYLEANGIKDDSVFAVADGNPRAKAHWIIMTQNPHATIMDNQFRDGEVVSTVSEAEFNAIFSLAQSLYHREANDGNSSLRLVSNLGQKFQAGQRLHMHVMVDKRFPLLFPEQYGLTVDYNNYAVRLSDNDPLKLLIDKYNNERIPNRMDYPTIGKYLPLFIDDLESRF